MTLSTEDRRALICETVSAYRCPSERALTEALRQLTPVSHATVSRDCRALGVHLRTGVCGAEDHLVVDDDTPIPEPLWYYYARIHSLHYKGLRRAEDRHWLQLALRLHHARKEGLVEIAIELEDRFRRGGHVWWE